MIQFKHMNLNWKAVLLDVIIVFLAILALGFVSTVVNIFLVSLFRGAASEGLIVYLFYAVHVCLTTIPFAYVFSKNRESRVAHYVATTVSVSVLYYLFISTGLGQLALLLLAAVIGFGFGSLMYTNNRT